MGDKHNGGGWIASLINRLSQQPNVEIAVGYFGKKDAKYKDASLIAYQIQEDKSLKALLKKHFPLYPVSTYLERKSWNFYEKKLLTVVNDFKPDVIHIWGSEKQFGLIGGLTEVPIVLHIQGILNPYYNSYLPPFFSWQKGYLNLIGSIRNIKIKRGWIAGCQREKEIFSRINNYIGRTEWDKRITKIFNPNANYFYGGEILRDCFYKETSRTIPSKLTIVSTISSPIYKGFDCILKTANILKSLLHEDFIWKVFGNVNPSNIESIIGLKHYNLNIELKGVADTETLIDNITKSTVYVHPSYIDNSPNSVCEAQLLGVSVIAANVGGLSSIICDEETGFLVPANDPYQMAYLIQCLYKDAQLNEKVGFAAKMQSLKRHDPEEIVKRLLNIYEIILNEKKVL